jgi:hypothetical protein
VFIALLSAEFIAVRFRNLLQRMPAFVRNLCPVPDLFRPLTFLPWTGANEQKTWVSTGLVHRLKSHATSPRLSGSAPVSSKPSKLKGLAPSWIVMAGPSPVGLQPTDLIRGHPCDTVQAGKAWITGTPPGYGATARRERNPGALMTTVSGEKLFTYT